MGNCESSDPNITEEERRQNKVERESNQKLSSQLSKDHEVDVKVNKLLLLGAGESGKSTLFKQMITLYGKGYTESDRQLFSPTIISNTILHLKVLVESVKNELPSSYASSRKFVNDYKEIQYSSDFVDHLVNLWSCNVVKSAFENRVKLQVPDSADYFFEKMRTVFKSDYIPSYEDILRARVRTTGIGEAEFQVEGTRFRIFDVGGQRSERKKWIHCFENVTAVLFVAALSEYDQLLFEDEKTNRMIEALSLFAEICNSRWFKKTSMILFLNKRDLFGLKIQKVPLTVCFPEYRGDNTYNECTNFIRFQFESKNKRQKQIYSHVTCAMDANNVQAVFNAVKDIIIRKTLADDGLGW